MLIASPVVHRHASEKGLEDIVKLFKLIVFALGASSSVLRTGPIFLRSELVVVSALVTI